MPTRKQAHPGSCQGLQRQRGVTLVEWMVSITIGLFLVSALTLLFSQQSRTQAELEKSSRQIENGRYAVQLLRDDIQLAGYYGEYSSAIPALGTLPDPCSTTVADIEAAMAFPVQGYDAPDFVHPVSTPPSCIAAANLKPGTDILVVRRASAALADALTIATAASAAGGQVYLQTGIDGSELKKKMNIGSNANVTIFPLLKKDGTSSPLRKFLVHIYFISPCSVMANNSTCSSSDDGGSPIPTLKMLELTPSGMSTTALVEGIEYLQIDYGFDAATSNDGAPDSYARNATLVGDWANVMALRVHVLARNNERSVDYTDDKTYNLGLAGPVTSVGDDVHFKRHVFTQLVRMVNPSSARDK